MAKPKKFPHRHYVYITDETNDQLKERADIMGLAPAVVLRIIVEHSLSGKPIKKGGSNGSIQQKK